MMARTASMLVLPFAGVLALGACDRDRDRDRRESIPGETRTRSGEMTTDAPRAEPPRAAPQRLPPPRVEPQRADPPVIAESAVPAEPRAPAPAPAVTDRRYDAGRLSTVGSAEDRDRNLGIIAADAAAAPATALPPAPPPAPPPAEPPPSPPTYREGAGRPGAAGDPYQ
jgi:hypothetical protein